MPLLWHEDPREEIFLPTTHQYLSILLYVSRKTLHCGRTVPPSCAKWWSCMFRERVWPFKIKWSAMDASTLLSLKNLYSSVWKFEGRSTCSKRLGRSFIDLTFFNSLFIKWHNVRGLSLSLPSKAWRSYDSLYHLANGVENLTQVQIHITISILLDW